MPIPNDHIMYFTNYLIAGKFEFGGLTVCLATTKLKSANISYLHIYTWRSLTEPPNLNCQYFCNRDLGPNCQIYFPPIFPAIRYYEKSYLPLKNSISTKMRKELQLFRGNLAKRPLLFRKRERVW